MNQIKYQFSGVSEKNQALFRRSIELAEKVIRDEMFKMILKDEIDKSNGLEGELSHWKDATYIQIYAQLFPIDMHIQTYYTASSVIGYGTAGNKIIHVNTKYLNNYKLDSLENMRDIFSNLFHEDTHDKGFEHDYRLTARRPNSVSYIINRVYKRTFNYIYDLPVEPVIVYKTPWYRKILGWFR